ncbi:ligand-binding protein SH3 [Desulfuribacillus alkaliarsenatis]|uniref:Ligand-binding protein SH3 n=2 Tax=Desulfuribacillus alkaliarsenatis TaxID=766136 RepID=A0A1E5G0S1_9FIRM|nr:ligand-binding protein SH3 [Desulfuribacillus alkaliarsenatis]
MKEYIYIIVDFLSTLPTELIVIIIAAMPVIELRGAIPVGVELGLPVFKAWYLSIIGNLLPILPILYFFQPISNIMLRFKWYQSFYNWLYNRTMRKSDRVQKYGAIGLIFFTAVPLPTTGAWTACLAAILFRIPIKMAFAAIAAGVIFAGVIVAILSGMFLG